MFGILSALGQEQGDLLARLVPSAPPRRIAQRDFHVGILDGMPCTLVQSRIGKVAAAITATLLIREFGVTHILFVGLAGGLAPALKVGDVVVATALIQHDLNAHPLFPKHEVPLLGRARFPTDTGLSALLAAHARQFLQDAAANLAARLSCTPSVHQGLVATGDQFIQSQATAQALQAELPDALCVEMEGAAVAQVCHEMDIPLAVLRVISDTAQDSAGMDFPAFLNGVAGVYANEIPTRVLRALAAKDMANAGEGKA